MTRDHEQQQENLGAYLLGALPELEAELFERHVMGCDACRDELDRLRVAADALPRSVEPVKPPASLKETLMGVVQEEAAERVPARRRRLLPRIVRVPTLVRVPAAAAWVSAAFLVAVGVAGGWGVSQLADSGEETLGAQVDRSRLPNGTASLTLQGDGSDGAVLSVHGLPQTVGNRVYQVWLRRGRDIAPSTLFTVRADGSGAAGIPESLDDVDEVMVTRERAGGASAPSERPVVRVRV
jgi:hypothetical protein